MIKKQGLVILKILILFEPLFVTGVHLYLQGNRSFLFNSHFSLENHKILNILDILRLPILQT